MPNGPHSLTLEGHHDMHRMWIMIYFPKASTILIQYFWYNIKWLREGLKKKWNFFNHTKKNIGLKH